MNKDVTIFINNLNHPLASEINLLREIILSCDSSLSESIKWSGPDYVFAGEDRIPMELKKKHTQNKQQRKKVNKNDRAIITFKTLNEIQANTPALKKIIIAWIKANQLK